MIPQQIQKAIQKAIKALRKLKIEYVAIVVVTLSFLYIFVRMCKENFTPFIVDVVKNTNYKNQDAIAQEQIATDMLSEETRLTVDQEVGGVVAQKEDVERTHAPRVGEIMGDPLAKDLQEYDYTLNIINEETDRPGGWFDIVKNQNDMPEIYRKDDATEWEIPF